MNLDPIRPYLSLIKTGLCVALLCGAFVAGCNHGNSGKDKLETQITALTEANRSWAKAGEESARQLEANKRFAKEQYELAEKLGKEQAQQRVKMENRISSLQEQLENAKRKPECAELLKQHYCSAVPLYLPAAAK